MTDGIRRLGSRRVVFGDVPDQKDAQAGRVLTRRDRTLNDAVEDDRPETWGDHAAESEEDRWLKSQRPPHWG